MLIEDLQKITQDDIDLSLVDAKLWNLRRFQGHPKALVVRQHTHLVRALAIRDNASAEVIEWAPFHDDHEAFIGDLHGLVVRMISKETDVLEALTAQIDRVICDVRGIDWPTHRTRHELHFYDKLAESIEAAVGLGWPVLEQHPEWPGWLNKERAAKLFRKYARMEQP